MPLLLLLLRMLPMMLINDDVESYGCGDPVASAVTDKQTASGCRR